IVRRIDACRAQTPNRLFVQETLRNGDRQAVEQELIGCRGAAPLERDQEPLDADGPADRRGFESHPRKERIIASSAADGIAQLADVALENETGVVFEIAQKREIDRYAIAVARLYRATAD